jgi:hypothetical protein
VGEPVWDQLAWIERELMICAFEASGVLAHVAGTRDQTGTVVSQREVAAAVLGLVDRGWVQVRRLVSWIGPDGRAGTQPSAVIAREDLDDVLADPATWREPSVESWVGAVTLSETAAGRRQRQGSSAQMP